MPTYWTRKIGCKRYNRRYCSRYYCKTKTKRYDMKVSEQCGIVASKGNQMFKLIRRNITYKKKLIIPLYKAIVRPNLQYCIQAWRPYRKKDIYTLEIIQRRATKMIPQLRNLSYEERLKECGLTTLTDSLIFFFRVLTKVTFTGVVVILLEIIILVQNKTEM